MEIPKKIRIVCATRVNEEEFSRSTALGRTLEFHKIPQVELRLFAENSEGLPALYNQAIAEAATDPAILMFVHDDVHLCDFYWIDRIVSALRRFDIVGLVGNRRRVPNQPTWPHVDTKFTWDSPENLSGIVGYGTGYPPISVSVYGEPLQEVKLLDGILLASVSSILLEKQLMFDEQFDFHFYDLDFCREAEIRNLTMGTCELTVVHESNAMYGSSEWIAAYNRYLRKWGS